MIKDLMIRSDLIKIWPDQVDLYQTSGRKIEIRDLLIGHCVLKFLPKIGKIILQKITLYENFPVLEIKIVQSEIFRSLIGKISKIPVYEILRSLIVKFYLKIARRSTIVDHCTIIEILSTSDRKISF